MREEPSVTRLDLVRQAVAAVCRAPMQTLVAATRPDEVKGWDSFGRLQVIMELERVTGRELPLRRAFDAASLGEIAGILDEELG